LATIVPFDPNLSADGGGFTNAIAQDWRTPAANPKLKRSELLGNRILIDGAISRLGDSVFRPAISAPTRKSITSPGGKTARQHLQACTCMDVQESQSNWPEMRKNRGQPGFCSTGFRKLTERTGTEQPTNPLRNSHFDTTRDAKYDARRFYCLRRLETPSITTNLQLICSPIYRVTISRPIQIYRVTIFRLQGHLQGHIKNP
jgi:hypothetical protein